MMSNVKSSWRWFAGWPENLGPDRGAALSSTSWLGGIRANKTGRYLSAFSGGTSKRSLAAKVGLRCQPGTSLECGRARRRSSDVGARAELHRRIPRAVPSQGGGQSWSSSSHLDELRNPYAAGLRAAAGLGQTI